MAQKQSLESELQKIRRGELERETERLSKNLGIPYLNLLGVPIQQEALLLANQEDASKGEFIVFQKKGAALRVATANPENKTLQEILEGLKARGFTVSLYFVSRQSLEGSLEQYKKIMPTAHVITGTVEVSGERIQKFLDQITSPNDVRNLLQDIDLARITEGLEIIFSAALKLDASDIHIEPRETDALLRFRIDGILQNIAVFSLPIFEKILSRIKILSELKLNIADSAQDGRFSIQVFDGSVDIRVSTIPTKQGESLVLRTLNPKKLITFEELGLRPGFKKILEAELAKTTGMLLVTGPTGSGKTTTLYAFLKKLASPDLKIITIEDPIEYRLGNISQTQVDPKKNYTFETGLRAVLRQDPDVVLVGEIRDQETAETALHAALTGHLVFSTLHTNDAPGAVARLIDMKINPTIIAPAINIVLAQRLIRRVCKTCVKLAPPDIQTKEMLEKFFKTLPSLTPRPPLKAILLPEVSGCAECNEGYKGRIGIFEFFVVNKAVEKLILENAPISALQETAKSSGMITVQQDAVLRAIEGLTTIQEVERVTGKIEV